MPEFHVDAIIGDPSAAHVGKIERLWEAVYVKELGWLAPGAAPHADPYHRYSTYILLELVSGSGEKRSVGTARLVFDSAVGLPIERFFSLGPLKEDRKFIEIQRLIIAPEFRSRRFAGAPFGLMARLMREVMGYAIGTACASFVVADVFDDPQVSPIGPLEQIGFDRIGTRFMDTELSSELASFAMAINRSRFLQRMISTPHTPLLRYVAGFDDNADDKDRLVVRRADSLRINSCEFGGKP